MIEVDPAVEVALAADVVRIAWLLELPDGLYFTTHSSDLDFGGNIYASTADILRLPGITRDKGIKLASYTATLSGVDGSMYAALNSRNMTGEVCLVHLAFLDGAGGIIGAPVGLYKGTFETWSSTEKGKTEDITIKLTNMWAKPNQTAGRIASTNMQQDHHAGDKFFELAHEKQTGQGWGKKG